MPGRRWRPACLVAAASTVFLVCSAGAAPENPGPPAPEALSWPEESPLVPVTADVGYLPGSGSVSPTGEYRYSIPIDVPDGRAGMAPHLTLVYGSRGGNGLVGVGWSLDHGGSEIRRCGKSFTVDGLPDSPNFAPDDAFCLDGQRLIQVAGPGSVADGAEYRTHEDRFTKIVARGNQAESPTSFEVFTREGRVKTFAALSARRITEEGSVTTVAPVWVLTEERDRNGNTILYHHDVLSEPAPPYSFEHRLSSIEYTAHEGDAGELLEAPLRKVVFDHEARPDPIFSYRGGIRYRVSARLAAIRLRAPNPTQPATIGIYRLDYEAAASGGRSFLASVRREDPKTGFGLRTRRFEWHHTTRPDFDVHELPHLSSAHHFLEPHLFDADGDGKDELAFREELCRTSPGSSVPFDQCASVPGITFFGRSVDVDGDGKVEILTPDGYVTWSAASQSFVPVPYGAVNPNLIDVDGDGLVDSFVDLRDYDAPGIDTEEPEDAANKHYVQRWGLRRNTGAGFDEDVHVFNPVGWLMTPPPWNEPAQPAVFDLNGDGRGELHVGYNTSHNPGSQCAEQGGAWQWRALGTNDDGTPSVHASYAQGPPCKGVLADINGDGLKDRLHLAGPDSTVRYNTGTGFSPEAPYPTGIYPRLGKHRFQVLDIDADGREDLLSSHEASSFQGTDHLPDTYLHLRRNTGFHRINLGPHGVPAFDPDGLPAGLQPGSPVLRPADVNGDGLTDLVVLRRTKPDDGDPGSVDLRVLVQRWAPHDLLFRVRDEGGSVPRETVVYSHQPNDDPGPSTCAHQVRCLRGGLVTAREHHIHRHDSPAATRVTRHDFHDPRSDVQGRGFLGFGEVRSRDMETRAETITLFDHETSADGRYPFAGLPRDIWRITPILREDPDAAGGVLSPPSVVTARFWHQHITHEMRLLHGGATHAVFPAADRVDEWDQRVALGTDHLTPVEGTESPHRIRHATRTFDDFGNEESSQAWTVGGQRCETYTVHENRPSVWLLGLPLSTEVTCGENGLPLPEPRLTTMEHDSRGQLRKITVEPDHPALTRTTTLHRDSRGLVLGTTDSAPGELSRRTYLAHDAEGVYARAAWNDLGHYSQQLVHPALGVPVAGQDPNGVQVHYRYDTLGRVVEITPDAAAATVFSHDTDPDAPWQIHVTRAGQDGSESSARTDEWGRTTETAHRGFDGQWVRRKVGYNHAGRPSRIYRPTKGQATSLKTTLTYDTLGRVVTEVEPNGATTTHAHSLFQTITTDPEGRQSRVTRDVDDRVIETANLHRGQWVAMTYHHGPFGQVTDVVDPVGNVVHVEHDKLGRRTRLDDPDRGTTVWTFNGYGEVTSELDALGDTTVFEHDLLGRVTWTMHDQEGITTFDHDGEGQPGELGRLTSTSSPDGIETRYQYDELGRNTQTSWYLPSRAYHVARTYDAFSRIKTVQYPHAPGRDRFVVKHEYNGVGYASALSDWTDPSDPKPLWHITDRNEDDELRSTLAGNGVAEHRLHDPATGRLEDLEAVKNGAALYALHYQHDFTGNLLERHDFAKLAPRVETFDHDALDRLTRWTVTHAHETREQLYSYDLLGNLTKVSGSSPTETLTHGGYPGDGPLQLPHALATRSTPGQPTSYYFYDARGRQTSGDGRTIAYKPFDLPSEIQQDGLTTRFSYDALHTRIRKVRHDPTGAPLEGTDTIAALYERRWYAAAPTEHVFYVHGTDGPVAQVVYTEAPTEPEKVLYLHKEALGSIGLVTDNLGEEFERNYHNPFGARTSALGEPISPAMGTVKLGFTGHRHDDELALVNMGGRLYDPAQRRFLTPDPLIPGPHFGQSYNRYSYALNNPLRYTDPTGFQCTPADRRCGEQFLWRGFGLDPGWVESTTDSTVRSTHWWASPDTVVTEIIATVPGTDATRSTRPHDADLIAENKGREGDPERAWQLYLRTRWSPSPSPTTLFPALAQAKRNLQRLAAAKDLLLRGHFGAAADTVLEVLEGNLQSVVDPIADALALPSTIDVALHSPDPEAREAAAIEAIQTVDTVVTLVAAVRGGPKGSPEKTSTLRPGPFAKESIPASGPGRLFTGAERSAINEIGRRTGCHTCGTTDPGGAHGNFIPDHQPPSKMANGQPQRLYPHCISCSRRQGGEVIGELTRKQ